MSIPTTSPGRSAGRIAVASALAFAVWCGLGTPAASAAQDARIDGRYGYVTFDAYGEVITAADIWVDGYGVRAYLQWDGRRASVTAAGDLYPVSRNLSIREGTEVWLTMCYTDNGDAFKCSDPKRAEA